jgi:hypothetical protein
MRIVGLKPKVRTYPSGKRRIKQTIYGNWNGYVGNKRVEEFGQWEHEALAWQAGDDNFDGRCG